MSSQYIDPIKSALSDSINITIPSNSSNATKPISTISSYVSETSVETFDLSDDADIVSNDEIQQKLTDQIQKICGADENVYNKVINYMKGKTLNELVYPNGHLRKEILDYAYECSTSNNYNKNYHGIKNNPVLNQNRHVIDIFADVSEYLIPLNDENKDTIPFPFLPEISDIDAIGINEVERLSSNVYNLFFTSDETYTELVNAVGEEEAKQFNQNLYNYYIQSITGKNIGEIIDKDGTLINLDFSSSDFIKSILDENPETKKFFEDRITFLNNSIDKYHLITTIPSGDANQNGVIDLADVSFILKHIKGQVTLDAEQQMYADVNSDGIIDEKDIEMLQKHIAGIAGYETLPGKSRPLPEHILNFKITEIVRNESGYDAVVLQDQDGNYRICSAQTNPKCKEDLSVIAYSLMNYLFDENIAKYLYRMIVPNDSTDDFLKTLNEDDDTSKTLNSEEEYYAQINDCYNLMMKYTEKAKKENRTVDLSGFSLGGGITATAYGVLVERDPVSASYVDSIDLYNPFLLYISNYDQYYTTESESWHPKISGDDIVNNLKDNEKLTIYSAEGDFVSTLHDYYDTLKDRFVFIKAKEINSKLKEGGGNTKENIDYSITNIKELYDLIIASGGNHGISAIYDDTFDENGMIKTKGEYQNINELIAKVTQTDYTNEESNIPDLSFLLEAIFESIIVENPENALFEYTGITGIDATDVVNYICENPRDFKTNEFLDIAIDTIKKWLDTDEAKEYILSYKSDNNELLNYLLTYATENPDALNVIIESIIKQLKKGENYDITMSSLMTIIQGDAESGIQQLINNILIPNLDELLNDNKDIIATILPDIIASKEIEELIRGYKWIVGDIIVELNIHVTVSNEVIYLLDNYPDIIPLISECIINNGFDFVKLLNVISPYLSFSNTPITRTIKSVIDFIEFSKTMLDISNIIAWGDTER